MGKNEDIAKVLEERGFPYTAEYMRRHGVENMNPWFWNGANEQTEEFYRECVENNKKWDDIMNKVGKKDIL